MLVYLDRAALEKAGAVLHNDGNRGGQTRRVLTLGDRNLEVSTDGSVTLILSDILSEVPDDLLPFVNEISMYDNFGRGFNPRRRIGAYRFRSASATLEEIFSDRGHYHVKVRAKTMADLRALYELIRQGKVWPTLDYEAEQVPPPFRNLRQAWKELCQLLSREVSDRLYRIREQVVG